jgi:peptidoglycan/xylan/chitin deacetylase (PgdA/CDA1 family)
MKGSGLVTFGAHSRSHAFLPLIKNEPGRLEKEIVGSKKALEDILGEPVLFFCYPKGGYDPDVRAVVRAAGFRAAVTTLPRHKGYGLNDPWALKRVKMSKSCINPAVLFFETSGFYMWLKEASS